MGPIVRRYRMSVLVKKCSRVLVLGHTRMHLWIKRGYAAQIYYLRGCAAL